MLSSKLQHIIWHFIKSQLSMIIYITSAEVVMFFPRIISLVCWFCQQDNTKTVFSTTFRRRTGFGPQWTPLTFGANLDKEVGSRDFFSQEVGFIFNNFHWFVREQCVHLNEINQACLGGCSLWVRTEGLGGCVCSTECYSSYSHESILENG